jgi:hypothetical protein
MRVLDAILLVLLIVGNALALPIWWWLLVMPIVRLMKRRAGKPIPGQLP